MPELPEVTTTVNGIRLLATQKTIRDVWCDAPNLLRDISIKKLNEKINGKEILGAERHGKNIIIKLSNDLRMRVHLKMTGHFMMGKWNFKGGKWRAAEGGPLADPFNRFIHFIINFTDGTQLALSDMRKFVKINLYEKDNPPSELTALGPDPMDSSFTFPDFSRRLRIKSSSKIKQTLLDQAILTGVGNIYSDEMLWAANINPTSIVGKIPNAKMKALFNEMYKLFHKSISLGGDSASDYRNIYGEKGGFQHHHKAYRLTGKPCQKKKCPGKIVRIKVAARSTHFCNSHQVLYN